MSLKQLVLELSSEARQDLKKLIDEVKAASPAIVEEKVAEVIVDVKKKADKIESDAE